MFKGWVRLVTPHRLHESKSDDVHFDHVGFLFSTAVKVYMGYPEADPEDNTWFWHSVFQALYDAKSVHLSADYMRIPEIIKFMTKGFKEGIKMSNMLKPEFAKFYRVYDSILQWLWLTEGEAFVLGMQGARKSLPANFPPRQRTPPWLYVPQIYFIGGGRDDITVEPIYGSPSVHRFPDYKPGSQINRIGDEDAGIYSSDDGGDAAASGQKRRRANNGEGRDVRLIRALRKELEKVKLEKAVLKTEKAKLKEQKEQAVRERDELQAKLDEEAVTEILSGSESEPEPASGAKPAADAAPKSKAEPKSKAGAEAQPELKPKYDSVKAALAKGRTPLPTKPRSKGN